MLMLTIALQVLTLMEFVSGRELFKSGESISGLDPGKKDFSQTFSCRQCVRSFLNP
jgi:hypothetical protein